MFYELISLGGYGAFVWPAFIFTLSSIFILFYISIKELKKNEKIYLAKISKYKSFNIKVQRHRTAKRTIASSRNF